LASERGSIALSRRSVCVALAVAVALASVLLLGTGAFGASSAQPANKAVASGSKVVEFTPGSNQPLMTALMKTSSPEDLIFNVSLECSIVTQVQTTGTQSAQAQGDIQVWVTLDGSIVPINSLSQAPQPKTGSIAGSDSDKATFCHRDQGQQFVDGDSTTSGDELTEYIATKSANSFDWVWLNASAGQHTITVWADLTATTSDACTFPGTTCSAALIGNRMLIVEPTKLANNAVI
jgi:hypothetical protein